MNSRNTSYQSYPDFIKGNKVKKPPPVTNFKKEEDRKSYNKPFLFLIVLLAAVSLVLFFVKKQQKKEPDSYLSNPDTVQKKQEIIADAPEILNELLKNIEKEANAEKIEIQSVDEKELFNKIHGLLTEKKISEAVNALNNSKNLLQNRKAISLLFLLHGTSMYLKGNYKESIALMQTSKDFYSLPKIDLYIADVYLKINDLKNAEGHLISYLEQSPNDEDALAKLASIYYLTNNLEKCKNTIARILYINPSNEKAKYYYAKVHKEKELEKKFETKITSHFIVKYEGSENPDVGYLVTILLEEAVTKIEHYFSYKPEDKIIVILYTGQQYFDVTRSPSWTGGLFDGKIRIPVAGLNKRSEELEKTLTHEYVHALIFRMTRNNAPVWLHEGLAMYLEGGEPIYFSEVQKAISKLERPPSIRYLSGSFMGFTPQMATAAYYLSFSFVKYLADEYGRMKIQEFLANLGKGSPYPKAFKDAYLIDIEEAERNWLNQLKNKLN